MLNKVRTTFLGLLSVFVIGGLVWNSNHPATEKNRVSTYQSPRFQQALKVVLEHEGYLSDDEHDKGGLTKWGISLRFLQLESIDIDGDGDVDRDDIMKLTKTDVENIYFKEFWDKNHYDQILDKDLSIKLMDTAVNTGANRAHKILKKSVNHIMFGKLTVDGTLSADDIAMINYMDASIILDSFRAEQAEFYRGLIRLTPAYKKFEKGWLKRAAS